MKAEKNKIDWFPTENDYELVFVEVDGLWREVSHNVAKYNNMLLCDYLAQIGIQIPDYTQFLRVLDPERNLHFEYRCFGGRVRIDVKNLDDFH